MRYRRSRRPHNPMKFNGAKAHESRWGHQSYRLFPLYPTRCFGGFIPLSLSCELDRLEHSYRIAARALAVHVTRYSHMLLVTRHGAWPAELFQRPVPCLNDLSHPSL